jgi:hypothetical protein
MNNIKYFIAFVLLLFTTACKNSKDNEESNKNDSLVITIEREYEEFNLCQPDSSLYPILDAVVNSVKECPKLRNKELLYNMWIYKDEDSLTRVSIELVEQKRTYCLSIGKILTYKGLIFNVTSNKEYSYLFTDIGLKVKYLCMKENILMGDHDGFVAQWKYILEKNKFKCISYGFCDQIWRDERYYKSQEE